ncbi:MAG TPA: hypothetical protein PL081_06280, partial [Pseudomonadales bacterium]|nr:hypothetical protein [Pseudomonadales bacterium]
MSVQLRWIVIVGWAMLPEPQAATSAVPLAASNIAVCLAGRRFHAVAALHDQFRLGFDARIGLETGHRFTR